MPKNPPEGFARITPYLAYNDVATAMEWLSKAFGFEKQLAMPGPEGSIMHAEMILQGGVVMMGPVSHEQGTKSPSDLPGVNQSLYVYVDDVDAHFARTKASGAQITAEPTDMFWGDRIYSARDSEGHHWSFAQHTKDVAPEDMKPPEA